MRKYKPYVTPEMMKVFLLMGAMVFIFSYCQESSSLNTSSDTVKTAAEIFSNPDYLGISYGGYRAKTLEEQPSIDELKEDMRLLHAIGIRVLRTYKLLTYPHAENVCKAIQELKEEDPDFEMYVMLGAWIDCKNAKTDSIEHVNESPENEAEIARAINVASRYPDIVKVIAVGNEAMVHWQALYYVRPGIILKWVEYLQKLKADGVLNKDLWITSSDNFAAWGGGGEEYHVPDLIELIHAVDFVSMHTYPMHDTHYNPEFWKLDEDELKWSSAKRIDTVMLRSLQYAQKEYNSVVEFMKTLGVDKPVHIGETGWASASNSFYGPGGSKACDEYKQAMYYELMRDWTKRDTIACFFFEAFDEVWKDAENPGGSENHFGLFTVEGIAKYVLWNKVDDGVFEGLGRNSSKVLKSFNGNLDSLQSSILSPDVAH